MSPSLHDSRWSPGAAAGVVVLLLAGCAGVPTPPERVARGQLESVTASYRPGDARPPLPALSAESPLNDFLAHAMLTQPQVEAAYYDWAASVRRITTARSLPDPRLTFSADIQDVVMGLVPGVMAEFPGPGKLRAAANVAAAESDVKYFAFEAAVLRTAFNLKKPYYQLHFLDAKIAVNQEMLRLLADLEKLSRARNEVGAVTLQDALRAQIEQERLANEIANLQDSRNPLLAQFKAALGLSAEAAAPPVPAKLETTPLDLTADRLLTGALARNPRLKAMEAEVRRADASIRLAYKARVPDFSLGLEADVKPNPVIFTPQVGMTLPVWRDKIAAQIAAAQAEKQAAAARFSAEQIMLAVEFAEKSFMFREATRNLELLNDRLLPKARQSLEVARSGYASGKTDFINLIDAQRTLLDFRLTEVEARIQRELALAELSLVILGTPPVGAPILPARSPAAKPGGTP
ncbi:MAG: outer membrane efflux protein [Limisphaerales bacterium]|nr:MAG: outer membrane efflux protein [Limisphaerales bacterium]KAG0507591.1 MAG: outer membrane efflux protein [Limisphaerales bacterium]TXT48556.1 MAG: outer membrane efflux protein [Limisphaerales bacterium]